MERNEQQTSQRIDTAVEEYRAAQAQLDVEQQPIIIHHPVDPELQPGESALLGGAMEIRAPWADKN